jgi:hypothetical protein
MWFLIFACASPPPTWEYALAVPITTGAGVQIMVESAGKGAIPSKDKQSFDAVKAASVQVDGKPVLFANTAEALNHVGGEGWEIVDFLGAGQYLLKRRRAE